MMLITYSYGQNIEYGRGAADTSLPVLKLDVSSFSDLSCSELRLRDLSGKRLWNALPSDNGSAANTLTVNFAGPVIIGREPTVLRLPVPEGTLGRGFSLIFYDNSGNVVAVATHSSPLKMRAGTETSVSLKVNPVCTETADVKRRGFYKSLFMDGGYALNHIYKVSQVPAIPLLGIENDYEYIGGQDTVIQYRLMVRGSKADGGKWDDPNGVLLYPDGAPRFRVIYVNGGESKKHGRALTALGRQEINAFFNNGGSYVGTCAGSIIPTTYVKSGSKMTNYFEGEKAFTFGLFPGAVEYGGLPQKDENGKRPPVFTHLEQEAPYLSDLPYFRDELRDGRALYVRHHNGNVLPRIAMNDIPGVERLMKFQAIEMEDSTELQGTEYDRFYLPLKKGKSVLYKNYSRTETSKIPKALVKKGKFHNVIGKTVLWAYKKNEHSGKMVVCGSHPEDVPGHANLFAGMIAYAMDGNGMPKVEDVNPGSTVNKTASDRAIGDRQYHHYRLKLTAGKTNVDIRLVSKNGVKECGGLVLSLKRVDGGIRKKEDLAWISDSEYVAFADGAKQSLSVSGLPAGEYAVSVFCPYSVKGEAVRDGGTNYYEYKDNLITQTGIQYILSVRGKKSK